MKIEDLKEGKDVYLYSSRTNSYRLCRVAKLMKRNVNLYVYDVKCKVSYSYKDIDADDEMVLTKEEGDEKIKIKEAGVIMKICVTKLVEELTVPDNFKEVFQLQKEKGLREYGELLHTFNGRDALEDLKQELVDSSLYFSQAILEGKREEAIKVLLSFIVWARAIEGKMTDQKCGGA